jgi:hypothetical protein
MHVHTGVKAWLKCVKKIFIQSPQFESNVQRAKTISDVSIIYQKHVQCRLLLNIDEVLDISHQ